MAKLRDRSVGRDHTEANLQLACQVMLGRTGYGRVSFLEIIESQALRALELLRRYDLNGNGGLDRDEFKKLMLRIDRRFKNSELNELFDFLRGDTIVAEVYLKDLLKPNLLRLKLIFDKYDTD